MLTQLSEAQRANLRFVALGVQIQRPKSMFPLENTQVFRSSAQPPHNFEVELCVVLANERSRFRGAHKGVSILSGLFIQKTHWLAC